MARIRVVLVRIFKNSGAWPPKNEVFSKEQSDKISVQRLKGNSDVQTDFGQMTMQKIRNVELKSRVNNQHTYDLKRKHEVKVQMSFKTTKVFQTPPM